MSTQTDEPKDSVPEWRALLRAELATLPSDHSQCIAALRSIHRSFEEELASALEPHFNAWLREMPHESLGACRDLASWCNRQLQNLGLAIKDPKSGQPCALVVDTRSGESDTGRFRLQRRDEHRRTERIGSWREPPWLTLTPAAPSRHGRPQDRSR